MQIFHLFFVFINYFFNEPKKGFLKIRTYHIIFSPIPRPMKSRARKFFYDEITINVCNFLRTINNNNLSTLPDGLFQDLYRLRTLRILENNFKCDCRLAWLAKWLRKFPKLGQYTKCASPSHLKGQSVADLHEQEFKCSGMWLLLFWCDRWFLTEN